MTPSSIMYRFSLLCLTVITGLYIAAFTMSHADGTPSIQLVSILQITDKDTDYAILLGYTLCLCLSAVGCLGYTINWGGSRLSRHIGQIGSSLALAMTVTTLGYACLFNWQPTFYEYYIGEALTVLCLTGVIIFNPNPHQATTAEAHA